MTSQQPSKQNQPNQAENLDENLVTDRFPVVGIGASAGGLDAFRELLSHLPTDTGMAFVLIQHLAPDHKSLLREILARETAMPTIEVRDNMAVEPNCVYVIPPNTKMTIEGGLLKLTPRDKNRALIKPVDSFFLSLAADLGSKAIAIVLSGGMAMVRGDSKPSKMRVGLRLLSLRTQRKCLVCLIRRWRQVM